MPNYRNRPNNFYYQLFNSFAECVAWKQLVPFFKYLVWLDQHLNHDLPDERHALHFESSLWFPTLMVLWRPRDGSKCHIVSCIMPECWARFYTRKRAYLCWRIPELLRCANWPRCQASRSCYGFVTWRWVKKNASGNTESQLKIRL